MADAAPLSASPLEDDWDEVAEGLPQHSDQFIQKYLQGRNALISQEKKQRSGVSVPDSIQNLSPLWRSLTILFHFQTMAFGRASHPSLEKRATLSVGSEMRNVGPSGPASSRTASRRKTMSDSIPG